MSMFVINESLNSGYNINILYLLSLLSVVLGISVIITKNPVISVLFLIGLFFSVSLYLMLIGLYFIGLSYLLVYVGAISILFLFILMLINIRISELVTEGKNSLILSIIVILSITISINKILPLTQQILYNFIKNINIFNIFNWENVSTNIIENEIVNININNWDNIIVEISHISGIGNILYTDLFIFLIITSLILLLAMVGCIVITIKRTNN